MFTVTARCEYPLVLIWSCVEEKNNVLYHEEALLIGKRQFIEEEIKITQDQVQSIAGKYVSSNLLKKINITNPFEFNNSPNRVHKCNNEENSLHPASPKWGLFAIFGSLITFVTALCLYYR